MKDDTVYLQHILECIRRIEEHAAGGRQVFFASHTLQDATLRNLQTMTEATQRLSDAVKASQPHIPWLRIAAFRNILVHNYLGIDLEQVWTIVQQDVPPLKQALSEILTSHLPNERLASPKVNKQLYYRALGQPLPNHDRASVEPRRITARRQAREWPSII